MAERIPREFIQQLLNRIEIVDLIDSRVPLKKKSGNNYFACCPFHSEKSASFSVSQHKQFYHCFGCGAHGNAIDFLIEFERLEFREAIKALANQVGLEIPQENSNLEKHTSHLHLYELLNEVAKSYQSQLRQTPRAIEYLKGRGLSGQIAKEFNLGFAPPGWDYLLQHFGKNRDHQHQLFETGMLIKKDEGGYYDRFRDRIVFPIQDKRGRVVGFGGRILDKGEPKYLNSPETPIFQKGHELYGLYQALQHHRQLHRALIVEGYMDVIALFQHEITYAVATLGTATTAHHLKRLFRYTPEIIFCFDGDEAGRTAAWRALLVTLPVMQDGIQVRFMFLPEGEDPDSLIRKEGKVKFEERLTTSFTIEEFFFQTLATQTDITSTDGRARFAKLATEHLKTIPESLFQQMMLEELARRTRLSITQLHLSSKSVTKPPLKSKVRTPSALRLAMTLLVQEPGLIKHIQEPLPHLHLKGYDLFLEIVKSIHALSNLTTGALLEYWRDHENENVIKKLATLEQMIPEKGIEQEFKDALSRLKKWGRKQLIDELLSKASLTSLTLEEKNKLNELIQMD